ncbi:MAG: lipopolysaccharide heptosyltransferase II [Deltaproteobacteria bacterium]|nr:lipopolysaccharide heptosyltransferase II [Deltaproteobacteria bacterium]MBW2069991.1 lipopolysaccharide heptosyltransferase II [Deltaproteobacteria bacterium]
MVAPSWIGDAVLSLPAIDACVQHWSGRQVTVLARSSVAQVFRQSGRPVGVMEYELEGGLRKLAQRLLLARILRSRGFAAALLLPNSFGAALLVWLAAIPIRIGYATDGRAMLLTHRLACSQPEDTGHQVDYYLHLAGKMAAARIERQPRLPVNREAQRTVLARFAELGLRPQALFIGVHPGAAYGEAKRWFPERFAAALDRLASPERQIILFGSAADRQIAAEIKGRMSSAVIDLVGRTTLAEAMWLISRCSLFVSNDSGLMHMAAAFRVPQVALFGSTDPRKSAPLNEHAIVLQAEHLWCAPCFKRRCPADLSCFQAITVEQVVAAAESLLQSAV